MRRRGEVRRPARLFGGEFEGAEDLGVCGPESDGMQLESVLFSERFDDVFSKRS